MLTSGSKLEVESDLMPKPDVLIGRGTRVGAWLFYDRDNGARVARVPHDLSELTSEIRQFKSLKSYLKENLPGNPRLEVVDFQGRQIEVVTCNMIAGDLLSIDTSISKYVKSLNLDEKLEFIESSRKFVSGCKELYYNLELLPDLVGPGNIGAANNKLYLLDLNNLSRDVASTLKGNINQIDKSLFKDVPFVTECKTSYFRVILTKGAAEIVKENDYLEFKEKSGVEHYNFRIDVSMTSASRNLIFLPVDSNGLPIFDRSLYRLYQIEKYLGISTKAELKKDPFYGAIRNYARSRRAEVVNQIGLSRLNF